MYYAQTGTSVASNYFVRMTIFNEKISNSTENNRKLMAVTDITVYAMIEEIWHANFER
jgi:hypothetical protein